MTVKTLKKQLAAAIAMVLVSVIALSSSTYAWFAANNQVKATGMNVKAQAEGGLIISNASSANGDWATSATAANSVTNGLALLPTSTGNLETWFHNVSNEFDNANAVTAAYTNLTNSLSVSNGVGFIDSDGTEGYSANDEKYYHVNDFYIKSSNAAIGDGTSTALYINKVEVSGNGTSQNLDKSLRVAIKIGTNTFIYAPFNGATLNYNVAGTTATIATAVPASTIVNTGVTSVTTIPAVGDTPIQATVYLYFEGEDENCKSSFVTSTLDTLQVSVYFGTTVLPTS